MRLSTAAFAAVSFAAAVATIALSWSCASRPPVMAAETPASPGAAALLPARADALGGVDDRGIPRLESVRPAKRRIDYLDAALSDYRRETLPNGATLAIKRQSGRRTAAARIVLVRDGFAIKAKEAGLEALALAAAARAAAGSEPGSVEAAVFEAGGSIELKLEDYDDIALELVCPVESLTGLLELVARALASPAFAQDDFDRSLREARVAERRESGDPLLRAAAELRSGLYKDHPYSLPPRGTAFSLAAATRESVMRYWTSRFSAERLFVVVVADADPLDLAGRLGPLFSALPRGIAPEDLRKDERESPAGAKVAALPIRPWFKALSLSATPGSAVIRGEFAAPEESSPDYAALTVALAMLDDLLLEGLRGERALAYGAWARISAAAAPSASVTVYKTTDPAAAKSAVNAAITELASGLCIDVGGQAAPSSVGSKGMGSAALAPLARSLDAYKARAITASYSRGASSEGMAAHIARDLAAGGDGTALFRMAGRISAVSAEDVARVARQRLLEGPSAWVALGDPDLVLGLPLSDFVPAR